jgi:hypothetical protein
VLSLWVPILVAGLFVLALGDHDSEVLVVLDLSAGLQFPYFEVQWSGLVNFLSAVAVCTSFAAL